MIADHALKNSIKFDWKKIMAEIMYDLLLRCALLKRYLLGDCSMCMVEYMFVLFLCSLCFA